jgi:WD40 repeat protein
MEARDSGSKIRPLPIDDLDADTAQRGPVGSTRRWAPLVVIAAGAIAFGIIANGLGSGEPVVVASGDMQSTAASPEDTTVTSSEAPVTTTTPPTLGDMVPVADGPMRLISLAATATKVVTWDRAASEPTSSYLLAQPISVSYNSDGSRLAVLSIAGGARLVIDDTDPGDPIYIRGATSGVWHPTDPDLLAWNGIGGADGSTTVVVADFSDPTSGDPAVAFEVSLPGEQDLLAWGDWGFITASGDTTFGWSADGAPTRSAAGSFFDAADDGTALMADFAAGGMPFLLSPDGSITEIPSLDLHTTDLQLTNDGQWVLATTFQEDGHTSIIARAVMSRSTRLTSIEEAAYVLGTAQADRFLVLQEIRSKDLVLKDWSNGAEYRLPLDDVISAFHISGQAR